MFPSYFDHSPLAYSGARFIHETSLGGILLWLVTYQAKGVPNFEAKWGYVQGGRISVEIMAS